MITINRVNKNFVTVRNVSSVSNQPMLSNNVENPSPHILLANANAEECAQLIKSLEMLDIDCKLSVINDKPNLMSVVKDRNFVPDFVFWCLELPGAFNTRCLKLMMKRKRLRFTPFIIYSGSANPGDLDYCYNTSSYDYFLRALSFLV